MQALQACSPPALWDLPLAAASCAGLQESPERKPRQECACPRLHANQHPENWDLQAATVVREMMLHKANAKLRELYGL